MKRRLALALAAALASASLLAPSSAAQAAEDPIVYTWMKRELTVHVVGELGPKYRLDQLLLYWSAGPVGLTLTDSPDADIVIRATRPYLEDIGTGVPTLQWSGLSYPEAIDPLPDDDPGDGIDDRYYFVGCRIAVQRDEFMNPRRFRAHVLSHEIGHCLGLPHLEGRYYSVMSAWPKRYVYAPTPYELGLLWRAYGYDLAAKP